MLRVILLQDVMSKDFLSVKSTAWSDLHRVWMAVLRLGTSIMAILVCSSALASIVVVLMLSEDVLNRDVTASIRSR